MLRYKIWTESSWETGKHLPLNTDSIIRPSTSKDSQLGWHLDLSYCDLTESSTYQSLFGKLSTWVPKSQKQQLYNYWFKIYIQEEVVSLFIENHVGLKREGYWKFQLRNLLHDGAKLEFMIMLNISKSHYYLFKFDL